MPGPQREAAELLARARSLERIQDWVGIVGAVADADDEVLLGEPELGFLLATALRRTGQAERALALAVALERPCVLRGAERLVRLRLNLEAALHFDRGLLGEAESRWLRLVETAGDARDDELLASACNNLGVIQTLQRRHDEALASYGRALAACQRTGDRPGMARAHQNLAITYRELGFFAEADGHFRSAIDHARAAGLEDVIGRADEERAIALLMRGDAPHAEAAARHALARLTRIGDRLGMGEALRVLGIVALAIGRTEEAQTRLAGALSHARTARGALLEAESLEALAAAELAAGDEAGAAALRADAERAFMAMGIPAWGRQVRARMARFASTSFSQKPATG